MSKAVILMLLMLVPIWVANSTHRFIPTIKVQNTKEIVIDYSSLIGIKYKWAGTDRSGFDCSGLVIYIYKNQLDTILPHSSKDISHLGRIIPNDSIITGDLLTFGNPVSHIGIALVGTTVNLLHCSNSNGVAIVNDILNNRYYSNIYKKAVRIINQ